jgi:hypothetical protein
VDRAHGFRPSAPIEPTSRTIDNTNPATAVTMLKIITDLGISPCCPCIATDQIVPPTMQRHPSDPKMIPTIATTLTLFGRAGGMYDPYGNGSIGGGCIVTASSFKLTGPGQA